MRDRLNFSVRIQIGIQIIECIDMNAVASFFSITLVGMILFFGKLGIAEKGEGRTIIGNQPVFFGGKMIVERLAKLTKHFFHPFGFQFCPFLNKRGGRRTVSGKTVSFV